MGVDTKGVVLTPFKDVLALCTLAQNALDLRIASETAVMFPGENRYSEKVRDQFCSVDVRLSPAFGMASFNFTYHGEARDLKMFFTCDCDHEDLAPRSVSLSMGLWGSSEVLMKTVLHALSLVGPAYFDLNDSDSIDLASLAEYRPNLLQAVKLRYLRPTMLGDWAEKLDVLELRSASSRDRFLGCKESALRKACALDKYDDRMAAWDALLVKVAAPAPRFEQDYEQEMAARKDAAARDAALAAAS